MNELDSFALNIEGVTSLVESGVNKVKDIDLQEEGPQSEPFDVLELPMSDEELLKLKQTWETKYEGYYPKIKPRQEKNKLYYTGLQKDATGSGETVVSSNLIFESEETFIPQAISKNPEPVIWSDNTEEGKLASNDIKTMMQYHADVLNLRRKLGVMVRHWSVYFIGVLKHGWDEKNKDITLDLRKPQNFILDPDGYVDEFGNFCGAYVGEKLELTAEKLAELYPDKKSEIYLSVDGKKGTQVVATEWWTDDYCFTSYKDLILEKHKNQYFNYPTSKEDTATPLKNHFANPKMPYTFLSVFSLQERPHDITNLIEQSIPNQVRITDREVQISRTLRSGNNSLVVSGISFDVEKAREAAHAIEDGDPVLVPDGRVEEAIKRLPANNLPSAIFTAQENDKTSLRSVFGVQGLAPNPDNNPETARGMILNQSHDSSRIGGGIGDALEQVADNVFNWWLQLYCVFYDEPHYGAVIGGDRAVQYVSIVNSNLIRNFVVSVSPDSMMPKDEISEANQAVELWNAKALDPITLYEKLNYPDPMASAQRLVLWTTNPQAYAAQYFPQQAPPQQAPQTGPLPNQPGTPPPTLGQGPANANLNQVPLNTQATPK